MFDTQYYQVTIVSQEPLEQREMLAHPVHQADIQDQRETEDLQDIQERMEHLVTQEPRERMEHQAM